MIDTEQVQDSCPQLIDIGNLINRPITEFNYRYAHPGEAHVFVGIQVDPKDADSVGEGLREALERREDLRGPALSRGAEFTWDRSAGEIEAVWGELE